MRYSALLVLLIISCTSALPIRFGPRIRYMIFRERQISQRETILYDESTEIMLFVNSEMFVLGFGFDAEITENLYMDLSGYWRRYEPKYVSLPISYEYPINREGSISMLTIGVCKTIENIFISVDAEACYLRESWTDPNQGNHEVRDSLSIGPAVGVGTTIELPLGVLQPEMGLIFPAFSGILGKLSLSLLLP